MYKFWFIAVFALLTGESIACSCAGYDIEESYHKYPSVFVGTVEKVDVIKRREPGSWFSYVELMQVTLKPDKLFKGSSAKKLIVMTRPGYGACGFPFKLNQQYAVFAYQDNKDLAVSSCSPTIHTEKGAQHYEAERLTVLNFLALQNGR
ncbi:hypothetical protein [Rheinheimera gaetbuli]